MAPSKPTHRRIFSASRAMDISMPVPTLMCMFRSGLSAARRSAARSLYDTCSMTYTVASAMSRLQRNSRSGVPVPHSSRRSAYMPYRCSMVSISASESAGSNSLTGSRVRSCRSAA